MAIVTDAMQTSVAELYVGFFNRAPLAEGMTYWSNLVANGATPQSLLADAIQYTPEYTSLYGGTPRQDVRTFYINVFGREPLEAGLNYWSSLVTDSNPFYNVAWQMIEAVRNGGAGIDPNDTLLVNNKIAVAKFYAIDLHGTNRQTADSAFIGVTQDPASVTAKEQEMAQASGATFTLTTGVDTETAQMFTGVVNGTTASPSTFTTLDTLTGEKVNASLNTLRLLDAGQGTELTTAMITPLGASLTNVGRLQIVAQDNVGTIGGGAEALSTAGTLFSGVSAVSVTNAGNLNIAAGTGQALTVTNSAATNGQLINGGSSQTVSVTGGAAIASAGTGVAVTLGGTTATTGAIDLTVSNTSSNTTTGTSATGGVITVNGGSTVEVNQSIAMTSAAAATLRAAGGNVTLAQGAVNVNGGATTTSVTVSQSAAAAAVTTAGSATAAITGGAVGITDRNAASTADTITTVTLNNAGAATITSNALSTLNLVGQASAAIDSSVTLDRSAGTAGATSMTINLDGGFIDTISGTRAAQLTTLNIDAGTDDSTIATLTAGAVTALNLSGDVDLTISTAATLANAATITSTNTSGVNLLAELGVNQTFNGGVGDDLVLVGATTKAINMGAGDDVVVISTTTLGTGGSINGGIGSNTIVANTNGSQLALNPNISNFQTLGVAGAAAEGTHYATGFSALEVGALKTGAGAMTFANVAAGVGLTYVESIGTGNSVVYALASATGTSDVLNVTLEDDAQIVAGTLTAANIETVNITGNFLGTTLGAVNTLTLAATSATTITVTGNVGLNLTNTGNVAVTSFNASGVTGAAADAANLAVTFASANATQGVAVSITGGSGNDTLTGGVTIDTIVGGAGNDTINGGAGADVIDGGTGTNTFVAITGINEGAGLGTSIGMAVNLGSTAVTAATINAAMGGGTGLSGASSSLAAGTTQYIYSTQSNLFATTTDTLANIQNVTGSTGRDYIVGSNGVANTITAAGGADQIIITETTAAIDTVVQGTTDSIVISVAEAAANFAAAQTLAFGNGLDVVTGFTAGTGGDVLDLAAAGAAVTAIGVSNAAMVAGTNYFLSGNFDATTGVFTITAAGAGADTMIVQGYAGAGVDINTNASSILLVGVDSDNLVAANFG